MAAPFAHLYSVRLVKFCREQAPGLVWDRGYLSADGSVSLERRIEGMMSGAPRVDPRLRSPPAIVEVYAAVRSGRLGLIADGDESLDYAVDIAVPLGLLRGGSVIDACGDEREDYVCARRGAKDILPRYYRPQFAAPDAGEWVPSMGSLPRLMLAGFTGLTGWFRGNRGPISDEDAIALVKAERERGGLSARAATKLVGERLVAAGRLPKITLVQWIERIRRDV
jgi:hypothetical protein